MLQPISMYRTTGVTRQIITYTFVYHIGRDIVPTFLGRIYLGKLGERQMNFGSHFSGR